MTGFTSISIRTDASSGSFGSGAAAFDPKYYLAKNADVARQLAGLQGYERDRAALQHFIGHGAREFRNPSALFDLRAYVKAYPDVAASGANPLLHYRTHGKAEGRQAFAVQDEARQSRAVPVPAADAGVFSLAGLSQDSAVLRGAAGQGAMAFRVEAAPAADATPVALAYRPVMFHAAVPQAASTSDWLPPQAGAHAAVLPAAGIEAVLPPVQGGHEVRLLTAM